MRCLVAVLLAFCIIWTSCAQEGGEGRGLVDSGQKIANGVIISEIQVRSIFEEDSTTKFSLGVSFWSHGPDSAYFDWVNCERQDTTEIFPTNGWFDGRTYATVRTPDTVGYLTTTWVQDSLVNCQNWKYEESSGAFEYTYVDNPCQ